MKSSPPPAYYKNRPLLKLVSVEQEPLPHTVSVVSGPKQAIEIARKLIATKDREHFIVMHINGSNEVVSVETASIGTLTNAPIHPREVFKAAILSNAVAIICAHNHPSGTANPSEADRKVFDTLKQAGELLQIPLIDFLIVSTEHAWSSSEHW